MLDARNPCCKKLRPRWCAHCLAPPLRYRLTFLHTPLVPTVLPRWDRSVLAGRLRGRHALGRPYTPPYPRWEGSVKKLGLLVQVPMLAIRIVRTLRLGLIGHRRFLSRKACL